MKTLNAQFRCFFHKAPLMCFFDSLRVPGRFKLFCCWLSVQLPSFTVKKNRSNSGFCCQQGHARMSFFFVFLSERGTVYRMPVARSQRELITDKMLGITTDQRGYGFLGLGSCTTSTLAFSRSWF